MERVGISGSGVELSLIEAVRLALENNPSIRISTQEVEARRFSLASRKGVFDPHFEAGSTFLSDTVPVGSILAGGESGTLSSDFWVNSAGLKQNLPFGGDWSLSFEAERSTTSNRFTQIDPSYPSLLGVKLNFPLLRNRSTDSRRLQILIASRDIEMSQAEFQRIALDLVTRVRVAYWNLIFAREDQQVKAEAVRLAEEQLERNRRLLSAGQVGEVDVVEADAARQRRQEEWLGSFEDVTARENDLKQLMLGSRSADLWQRELIPVDRNEAAGPDPSIAEAWQKAAARRPELQRLESQAQAQQSNSDFLQNQTKPALDLFASYAMNGLAGRERVEGNPFTSQNGLLFERVNSLSGFHDLETLPVQPSGGVPERLGGGLGQSLSNLFSNDFRTASLGIRLEFPLGNHEIKGELAVSRVRERQLELERAALEQQIESEIRNALQAVYTRRQRVQAAAAAKTAAMARLESEQRLFQAGETTNFLLLTRQAFFIETSGNEVRAAMDLNIALARLQQVIGTALESLGIDLEAAVPPERN